MFFGLSQAVEDLPSPILRVPDAKKHVVWGHRSPKHNLQHANYLNGCFFLCCRFFGFLDVIKSYVKHARIMENVKELFWCDAMNEQGRLQQAPDCEQRDCFVVQGKKQETNTGAKAKMPDRYRCTITCAFCGKRKQ